MLMVTGVIDADLFPYQLNRQYAVVAGKEKGPSD
jgi:hypothetical protein